MKHPVIIKMLSFCALLFTATSSAENITVLNHNFEHDAIPPEPGYTTHITGWVNSGFGGIGIFAPEENGSGYLNMGGRAQIAYLNHGGRISQTASASLIEGEIYTLTFDIGQRIVFNNPHFVARIKSQGETLAQLHSDSFNIQSGEWTTQSFSFTATSDMPIGNSIVVEFQNLATESGRHLSLIHI